jgi:hypothetical protein
MKDKGILIPEIIRNFKQAFKTHIHAGESEKIRRGPKGTDQ